LAQSSSRFCAQCGSPIEVGHRFCTNCGATTSVESNAPTALATGDRTPVQSLSSPGAPVPPVKSDAPDSTIMAPNSTPITPNRPVSGDTPVIYSAATPNVAGVTYSTVPTAGSQFYAHAAGGEIIPPPPPPDSYISPSEQTSPTPYYAPPAPGSSPVPPYARAPKRSRGCLVASVVLLLVLVLGGTGVYFAVRHGAGNGNQSGNGANGQQSTPSSGGGSTPSSSGSTPNGSGGTPATGRPVTEQLNLKFTYSSIDLTLVSVQQASSFSDDSSTSQGGVRISMKESNPTTRGAPYAYGDVVRLVLPDASIVPPSNEKNFEAPAAGVSQDNWIDFAVTEQSIDLSKLVLRFGASSENQMNIPLVPNADLSKYQPKTVTPNTTFRYIGMSWTLTSATESLSANGQQAKAGMIYIVVTLKAVNSSGSDFGAYPGDYIRLKSGDTTAAPADFTFPIGVASQATGMGTFSFTVPQGSTSFTLLMLGRQTSPPINAASATFQIQ
jgi:hypothetical protein